MCKEDQGSLSERNRIGVRILFCLAILAAAAAVKLLQSCPTLCDPIDSSPLGSSVPGILQARILEWDLDSILKSRDITLPTKVCLVKAMVFPVIMYGCEELDYKES